MRCRNNFQDLTHRPGHPRSSTINDRPFAALATVQRVGTDLRYHLDRSSYGNILALTRETGQYVQQIFELFDAPDIKRFLRRQHQMGCHRKPSPTGNLGGAAEMSQRAKMADAGRRTLQYIAENDSARTITLPSSTPTPKKMGSQADAWLAAYRLTREGRRFPGLDGDRVHWSYGSIETPPRA